LIDYIVAFVTFALFVFLAWDIRSTRKLKEADRAYRMRPRSDYPSADCISLYEKRTWPEAYRQLEEEAATRTSPATAQAYLDEVEWRIRRFRELRLGPSTPMTLSQPTEKIH
jgi:hypothetical protein